jgi:geranylgeranyl diphosphate synthase, type II
MHTFLQLQQLFEQHLSQHQFKNSPANLYDPCRHIMQLGGKRVRPTLLLMAHELFSELNNDAYNAADAIELFHNFTLIHDDIMDQAPLRRSMPTVHTKWNMPTAILSGDVMNIYAYEALNKISITHLHKVINVFNKTAIEVCEGQQLDMDFESRADVSIAEYIEMITLKTSVLLAASMQIGAILGGATDGTANLLYEFGKNLGISFQLKDDYLDAFGEGDKIGKQVGGDIIANKKTFLLLKAQELATDADAIALAEALLDNSSEKVQKVLAIFDKLQIKQEAQNAKEKYSKLAFDYLDKLPVQETRKQELHKVADWLLNREA